MDIGYLIIEEEKLKWEGGWVLIIIIKLLSL